jgi:hypothetical protein
MSDLIFCAAVGQPTNGDGCLDDVADGGTGRREPTASEDDCRRAVEGRDCSVGTCKKVVRPVRRCEMAERAVQEKGVSIKLALGGITPNQRLAMAA